MRVKASTRLNSFQAYAFSEIDDKVKALRQAGVKPIDFGVGDPSEPVPDFILNRLNELGRKHATSGYPNYTGSDDFRAAAADYMYRRFGVKLDPATEICSSSGSKEAIFNLPAGFIEPGDTVIVPSPAYPPMKAGTIFAGGVPYFVPLLEQNDFLIDYASIPNAIAQKAKIMWLNYPNSPTGAAASKTYYKGLVEWARANNIILAADEGCYIDIYFGEKPPSILEVGRDVAIAFYSLSKRNNMTGYRVGFVAGDSGLIDLFKKLKTNIDSGTANLIQDTAIVALKNDSHAAEMRALYGMKGDILERTLNALDLEVNRPTATFYFWQKVPKGFSDVEFATRLLDPEIGIVVTPGTAISNECKIVIDGTERSINPGAGFVRFALVPTIDEMKEAENRLKHLKLK